MDAVKNGLRFALRSFLTQFARIPLLGLLVTVPRSQMLLALRDAAIILLLGTGALWLPGLFLAVHLNDPVIIQPVLKAAAVARAKGDFLVLCPSIVAPALILFFGSLDSPKLRSHQRAVLGFAGLICVISLVELAILISAGISSKSFVAWSSNWLLGLTAVLLYFYLLLDRVPNDSAEVMQRDEDDLLRAVLKSHGQSSAEA